MGGANWPPSSYDPETNLLYVCASDRISNFVGAPAAGDAGPEQGVHGRQRSRRRRCDDAGVFAALDVRTNKLAWRQQWREICYSGSVVTGGGLVFVGRADGRLTALDKRNGAKLWEFMTDAGVNTTVTTFEHKGKQYVVVHAGGGAFANGKRGDGDLDVLARRQDRSDRADAGAAAPRAGSGWPGARAPVRSRESDACRWICRPAKPSTRPPASRVMARRARAAMAAARRCRQARRRRRSGS